MPIYLLEMSLFMLNPVFLLENGISKGYNRILSYEQDKFEKHPVYQLYYMPFVFIQSFSFIQLKTIVHCICWNSIKQIYLKYILQLFTMFYLI